jgi:hypothetical protein
MEEGIRQLVVGPRAPHQHTEGAGGSVLSGWHANVAPIAPNQHTDRAGGSVVSGQSTGKGEPPHLRRTRKEAEVRGWGAWRLLGEWPTAPNDTRALLVYVGCVCVRRRGGSSSIGRAKDADARTHDTPQEDSQRPQRTTAYSLTAVPPSHNPPPLATHAGVWLGTKSSTGIAESISKPTPSPSDPPRSLRKLEWWLDRKLPEARGDLCTEHRGRHVRDITKERRDVAGGVDCGASNISTWMDACVESLTQVERLPSQRFKGSRCPHYSSPDNAPSHAKNHPTPNDSTHSATKTLGGSKTD